MYKLGWGQDPQTNAWKRRDDLAAEQYQSISETGSVPMIGDDLLTADDRDFDDLEIKSLGPDRYVFQLRKQNDVVETIFGSDGAPFIFSMGKLIRTVDP